MPVSSSVGFFTVVQNDVWFRFLLRGKWHEVPIGDKNVSLRAVGVAIPRNKARHIERKRNIPPNYRNTHYTVFACVARQSLFSLSLRGSVATAAIPSKN